MHWPLLDVLTEDEQRQVLAAARRRRFARGEVVFHEGDPGDTMHLIAEGHLCVRVTTPLGDVGLLRVLGPGDFFGEMAVLAPAPRNATVAAMEPAQTLALHRDVVEELCRDHPAVERVLNEALILEVRRLSTQLLDALYVPVEKRVLRRLVELAELFTNDNGEPVIPLTQEELAQMAGTTRPTANKVIRAAEEAGLVRLSRGQVAVVDREALQAKAR